MELHSIHTSWLIPGEKTPCDIYFYFRGKYVVAIKAQSEITLEFVGKLIKTEYPLAYIEKTKLTEWNDWTRLRHPHLNTTDSMPNSPNKTDSKQLYGNKRAEFVSFLQKAIVTRDANDKDFKKIDDAAIAIIRKAIQGPAWDWYFNQFHEPPDLFHHAARITYLACLMALKLGNTTEAEMEYFVQSCIIHELDGDPASSMNLVVSEVTLKTLESEKYPISKEVIDMIRLQDELVSGKGFPKNLKDNQVPTLIRIFGICNHFDHFKIKSVGANRRVRFEQCKKNMDARKSDYDPKLYEQFWALLTTNIEVVG